MNAVRSIVRAQRINTRAIELKMGISLAQLFVLQQLAERPSDSLNDLAERTATHQSSVSVVQPNPAMPAIANAMEPVLKVVNTRPSSGAGVIS